MKLVKRLYKPWGVDLNLPAGTKVILGPDTTKTTATGWGSNEKNRSVGRVFEVADDTYRNSPADCLVISGIGADGLPCVWFWHKDELRLA